MSDVPGGENWWKASDEKWYPPEQKPGYPPEQEPGYPAEQEPAEPIATERLERRRPSPMAVLAIAIVSSFVAGAATGWVIWRGDDAPTSASEPTLVSTTTTTVAPEPTAPGLVDAAVGGSVEVFPGATVIVPAGAISGDGLLSAEPAALPAPVGSVLVPAGPLFDLELEGAELTAPVTVQVELGDQIPLVPADVPEELPTVFALHWTGDEWEQLSVTYDPATGLASFDTTSFSIFGIFTIAWDVVKEAAEQILEGLTGGLLRSVSDPACARAADEWGVRASSGPMLWCSQDSGEGHELNLVNKERYAVLVSWTEGATDTTSSQGDIASQISDLLASGRATVVGPGRDITIRVDPPTDQATVQVEYDGLAQGLTAVLVSAEILAWVHAKVPFTSSKTVEEILSKLHLVECFTGAGIDVGEIAAEPFTAVTDLVRECFGTEALTEMFGSLIGTIFGGIVALIGSTISFFIGSGTALWDILRGEADQTFNITKGGESDDPVSADDLIPEFAGWPTGDNEGSIAFFTYLGASFIFPAWTSCSENFCIAGTTDTVYAFDLRSGIDDFGSIPIDDPDPVGAFIAGGVSEAEVADLFAPG